MRSFRGPNSCPYSFPVNVIVDMLGLDQNDRDRFQRWYTSIIAFLGNLNRDPGIKAAGKRTRKEFAEYLLPIIRQRRGNLGDDLLSVLCAATLSTGKRPELFGAPVSGGRRRVGAG